MTNKTEFKAKLDGSFEHKLRAAYMAGFQAGGDDGDWFGPTYEPDEIEDMFQSWLKNPQKLEI